MTVESKVHDLTHNTDEFTFEIFEDLMCMSWVVKSFKHGLCSFALEKKEQNLSEMFLMSTVYMQCDTCYAVKLLENTQPYSGVVVCMNGCLHMSDQWLIGNQLRV